MTWDIVKNQENTDQDRSQWCFGLKDLSKLKSDWYREDIGLNFSEKIRFTSPIPY